MVLMNADRQMGVSLHGRIDQMLEKCVVDVVSGVFRSLKDNRAVGLVGGPQNRLDRLQVGDVERRRAVSMLGGMIEYLSKRNEQSDILYVR